MLSNFNTSALLTHFMVNFLSICLAVLCIYFPKSKNKEYSFAFIMVNILIFFVCYLVSSNELHVGAAFGLFAVFSILRYRTDTVPVREMTFFFLSITISVINALSIENVNTLTTLLINGIIISLLFVIHHGLSIVKHESKEIVYERIELIQKNKKDELIQDLKKRTGLKIYDVEIKNINFLNDTALLLVRYKKG